MVRTVRGLGESYLGGFTSLPTNDRLGVTARSFLQAAVAGGSLVQDRDEAVSARGDVVNKAGYLYQLQRADAVLDADPDRSLGLSTEIRQKPAFVPRTGRFGLFAARPSSLLADTPL